MPFSNLAIDTTTLPKAELLELRPLQPAYRRVLRLQAALQLLLLLGLALGVAFLSFELRLLPTALLLLLAAVLAFAWQFTALRSFALTGYALRQKDVVHKKGWLVQRTRICPFNRVQNCTVQSGPLERRANLASLIVYTAGDDAADLRIRGLLAAEAEDMRQFILQQIHREDAAF